MNTHMLGMPLHCHCIVAIIEAYYTELSKKNIGAIEKYLHRDVELISPLSIVKSKTEVIAATKGFVEAINSLSLRAKFGSTDQAILVYDAFFPEPIGVVRGTSLMTFSDGLVTHIELFYDARPVV